VSKLNMWGWDKKERTMLRFIKSGDIFCFQLNEYKYCFGRIISELIMGHVSEIIDYTSSYPIVSEENLEKSNRLAELIILDSYTLFDRKLEGEWRIIGHQEDYTPTNIENVYFTYGVGKSCKKVDLFDNESLIEESDKGQYSILTSRSDMYIKKLVNSKLEQSS
jgi:hypothetical protein